MYAGYYEEGDTCPEHGCFGKLYYPKPDDCSCHINSPCMSCISIVLTCSECGWEDVGSPPYRDIPTEFYGLSVREYKPQPLDPTKVSYRTKGHSPSSMIKEGVYPEGMTADEVRKEVDGTFGGRFERFGGGKFKFIAYTD